MSNKFEDIISELKNISLETVLKQTLTNSINQFDLDI